MNRGLVTHALEVRLPPPLSVEKGVTEVDVGELDILDRWDGTFDEDLLAIRSSHPSSGLVVEMSALDLQAYRDGRLDLVGDRLRNFHAVVPAFRTSQLEFGCSNDQAIPRFRGHHLARQPRSGFTLGVHRQHLLLVGAGQTHLC